MSWLARAGWAALATATLAVAAAVHLVELPAPRDATALDRALYLAPDGSSRTVSLPHTADRGETEPGARAEYRVPFDLDAVPAEPLFVLVPAVNRRASLVLKGAPLVDAGSARPWTGPLIRAPILVQLPHALLDAGRNVLTLTAEPSPAAMPGHVSNIYVGTRAALQPTFRLRVILGERLLVVAVTMHALLGIGILIAYLYRPRDPLFSWLAAMVTLGFVLSAGIFAELPDAIEGARMYFVALTPAAGLLSVGVALALIGTHPPRLLHILVFAVPGLSLLWIVIAAPDRPLLIAVNVAIMLATLFAAVVVMAWGALRRGSAEAGLMLPPFFLTGWLLFRDLGVVVGLFEGPYLMTPYGRPFLSAAVMALLMWRLAKSLDQIDRANEHLRIRLAEREAELEVLHRAERIEGARLVREEERQRLTRDLHDGISGHLVSIIAMAERAPDGTGPIETAARQALDDLRLVIYSLDLGDSDLPLALANFRERLAVQLQRSGVALDWSTADLPDVSGVTPANALSILRILQEAVTNALKHGPARRLAIRGTAAGHDRVAIMVDNDGRPFAAGTGGHGLANMRRRAQQLCGDLEIGSRDGGGVRLTLRLPRSLPASAEEDNG